MTDIHERKCHDCGNVAMHQDRITPWVLCSKCGSQDTRATKKSPIRPSAAELAVTMAALVHKIQDTNDYHGVYEIKESAAFIEAEKTVKAMFTE